MTHRLLACCTGLILATACSPNVSRHTMPTRASDAHATTTKPVTTNDTAVSSSGSQHPPRCDSPHLRLTFDRQLQGVMNQTGAFFKLTNTSSISCSMLGYPGFQPSDAAGHPIPINDTRGSSYVISDPGPHLLVLQPGASAYFGVGWADYDVVRATSAGCATAAAVASVPPDDLTALTTPATLTHLCGTPPAVIVTAVAFAGAFAPSSP